MPSRRTTSAIFACVFRPSTPYATWTPARSSDARPLDVVLLVEARLQLDEHGDLLAVLGRTRERRDDRRVGADAVERHLDREDVRVVGGVLEEPEDGVNESYG